ncbi:MAG: signal recognition particle-docking protein FtsY [Pseudomonadota bacterium]
MMIPSPVLAQLAAQSPAPLVAPTAQDLVGLLVIGGLSLIFVILAVLFVIKSRRKRIAELTEALEANELEARGDAGAPALPSDFEAPAAVVEPPRAVVEKAAERSAAPPVAESDQGPAVAELPARAPDRVEAKTAAVAVEPEPEQPALPPEHAELAEEDASQRRARLRVGLHKTRSGFIGRLSTLFGGKRELDPSLIDELEQILLTSDVGVKTADHLLQLVRGKMANKEIDDAAAVRQVLKREIRHILQPEAPEVEPAGRKPHVIMVIGVNGGGKTTTVGKLAHRYAQQGLRVVLGAGDTFRAAAVDQLEVWAQRAGVSVVRGKEGQDPSSVLFEAVKRATDEDADVVIADTAGRLHTKVNLMEELKKVERVLGKAAAGAPHEVLLVLDATTGQNAIAQAAQFSAAVPVNGVVLTKLDGTAKGGVIVGICKEFGIPVKFIGIGEKLEDLRPFDAEDFVEALFELG